MAGQISKLSLGEKGLLFVKDPESIFYLARHKAGLFAEKLVNGEGMLAHDPRGIRMVHEKAMEEFSQLLSEADYDVLIINP